jgi:hypothetical protein
MTSDAKHSIFLSIKRGGIGIKCFTREYIGALLRDIEVYMTNYNSLPAHALVTSLEEATKQKLWRLSQNGNISNRLDTCNKKRQFNISGKKTIIYQDDFDDPHLEFISYDHTHIMECAVSTSSKVGDQ